MNTTQQKRDALTDRLAEAFRNAADLESDGAEIDHDLIWRVVDNQASHVEVRDLADRAARQPQIAEAWRLALAIQRERSAAHQVVPFTRRFRPILSLAALVLICLAIPVLLQLNSTHQPVLRGSDHAAQSLIPEPAACSRESCELKWTSGGQNARYDLLISTDALEVIASPQDLDATTYLIPESKLRSVEPGEALVWQVTTRLADGTTLVSNAFTITLSD